MKRLHIHLSVKDLNQSIQFYNALFGIKPSVKKPDYAKWLLDDPAVNFALSQRGKSSGVDHLGIQVETIEELDQITQNLRFKQPILEEKKATCCYAKSDKSWLVDPQGIAWEAFVTHGASEIYGESIDIHQQKNASCCVPKQCHE